MGDGGMWERGRPEIEGRGDGTGRKNEMLEEIRVNGIKNR